MSKPIRYLIVFCSLLVYQLSSFAQAGSSAIMPLRIAAVSGTEWCDPKKTTEVEKQIDAITADGFNAISLGTFKFMPMYFVHYSGSPYKDAAVYTDEKIDQNIAALRSNMQRAKRKGISLIFSRSYSHYIPYSFWKSRPEIFNPGGIYTRYLENAHQNDLWQSALKGKKDEVIGHQQWTNPVYKNYFIYSTYEMLKVLPELDGFLNAYAEAAWTLNEATLKADNWKNWKDCINYDATDENFIDYVNTLHRILQDTRGEKAFLGIRDWYVDAKTLAKLNFPLNQFYIAVKYGGFDQPVVNYAPWADSLKAKGLGVIHDMLVYDAEHPHPLYWYSNDFITRMLRNLYKGAFPGVLYQDFQIKGDDDADNPIRVLTQITVGRKLKGQSFERSDAISFLKKYYGAGAESLLQSLEDVARAQEENIKLKPAWFWQGDGLTPGGPGTERYWMFMDNPEAPKGMAFIRQDVIGVKEYTDAFLKGTAFLQKQKADWKTAGRKIPEEAMSNMEALAQKAVDAALEARKQAPSNAPHMKELVASAVIHQQLVLRDNAFLRSALAFYASGGQYDGKYNTSTTLLATGYNQSAACMQYLEQEVYHDQLITALCSMYMPRRPKVRGTKPYDFTRKIASLAGQPIEIKEQADVTELNRLTQLIEGKK